MAIIDESLLFLHGGGELGQLIRTKDWAETPLGPPERWPQSLKTTLGIILNSRYPMFVFWGPQLVKIYNDGYRPITGHKHPWALGRPGPEVWPEIWDDIKPLVDRAIAGDPTWSDDLLLFMERNGFPEEVYFTFSYSPIPDESGGVGGMLCACTETTGEVLGERRLRTLRDLAAAPADARTVTDACALSADALRENHTDLPFALIYLLNGDAQARLVATAGTEAGRDASPSHISADGGQALWPVLDVAHARVGQYVDQLGDRFGDVPAGPWPEPPSAAMVLPLVDRGLERSVGALVLGLSSRRPFDDEFRGWCELVAGQISASITNARAAEEERKRAAALAELDRARVGEALRWQPGGGTTFVTPVVSQPGTGDHSGGRLLVADDNADMREYLTRLLAPFWTVESVSDGSRALAAAQARPPDLLLADVMMPGIDGFELLRAIRSDASLRMIPVILLSARAGETSRVAGIGADADDYVVKPFSAQELLVRVSTHLQRGRVRRELAKQRAQLYALFEQAPAAIAVLMGNEHRVVFANARYSALCGRSPDQLLNRPLVEAFPELAGSTLFERLDHVLETGETFYAPDFEMAWDRPGDGARTTAYFDWTCQPIRDGDGLVEGTAQFFFDVTEQVQTRIELDNARAAAEAASRAKDEFLAMLGHELRNPLSPIMTALQLMRLRGTIGAEHERSVIERQVKHMVSLVDDLLDVSRIARGKVQLRLERVEVADAVAKAIEMTSPAIDERRHVLDVDVPRGLVVDADPARLSQVVANLLSNAAKYTDAGGRIAVAAQAEGNVAVLRVRDNGTGIDADMLPRVFDLFSQERQTIDRSQGGLGLGLAIVRSLVEAHRGTVSASSAGRGSGSEFAIRIPLDSRDADRQAPAAAAEPVVDKASRLKVLVVDDNADAAQLLAISLRAIGFVTAIALDGPRAIEQARAFRPDVVLLDLGLPVMDGFEVALRLKSDPELRHAKLVAVTGYGQTGDRERTRAMGFDEHFVKPVDFDHLENWLRAIPYESEG